MNAAAMGARVAQPADCNHHKSNHTLDTSLYTLLYKYIYIYIYTHTHVNVYIYIYIHTYIYRYISP